jgi:general secretion pathway protein E
VTPQADQVEIRQLGYKQGMRPLRISGAEKIHAGISTLEEVFKVSPLATD